MPSDPERESPATTRSVPHDPSCPCCEAAPERLSGLEDTTPAFRLDVVEAMYEAHQRLARSQSQK